MGSKCNNNCDYCYVKPFQQEGPIRIMGMDVLEPAIASCVEDNDFPTITWHGGEPTLAGLGFFQKVVELTGSKPCRNILQTHAMLIDQDFAAFLKQNNFEVSVSLDGPREVHGIHRKQLGRNTFDDVMRGINFLRDADIMPSISATVTRETLQYAKETFSFFAQEGFRMLKFNAVFDSVRDKFSIPNDLWLDYLTRIFWAWAGNDDPGIVIREMDEVIFWITGDNLPLCSDDRSCLNWVSVDPDGELYPCEYMRSLLPYGNIRNMPLSAIRRTDEFQRLSMMFEILPAKCRDCEFAELCGNGCPATRELNGKLSPDGVYVYCEQRKGLYETIKQAFGDACHQE